MMQILNKIIEIFVKLTIKKKYIFTYLVNFIVFNNIHLLFNKILELAFILYFIKLLYAILNWSFLPNLIFMTTISTPLQYRLVFRFHTFDEFYHSIH